jgi:hypothetical protein
MLASDLLVSVSTDLVLITSLATDFEKIPNWQSDVEQVTTLCYNSQTLGLLINSIKTSVTMFYLSTFYLLHQ